VDFKLILLTGFIACGLAMTANAGSIADTDSDLIPDVFDNCLDEANGPGETSPQNDTDQDGFGNACDADFNNNGVVDPADFAAVVAGFNQAPGPSGLGCADATIMVGMGDAPCP